MKDTTIYHGLLHEFVFKDDETPFDRLDERSCHVVRLALRQALELGSTRISPEHLLLAVLRISDEIPVYALSRLNTSPYEAKNAVLKEIEEPSADRVTGRGVNQ